jgi:hypothetical protein
LGRPRWKGRRLHRANVATNGIRCSQNFCAPKATCRIVIPSREDGEGPRPRWDISEVRSAL